MSIHGHQVPLLRKGGAEAFLLTVMHTLALYGIIYLAPWSTLNRKTLILAILSWQLPCFG